MVSRGPFKPKPFPALKYHLTNTHVLYISMLLFCKKDKYVTKLAVQMDRTLLKQVLKSGIWKEMQSETAKCQKKSVSFSVVE